MPHKMSASHAFPAYSARILWLTKKIENCDARGLHSDLFRQERAAMFWFVDKVIEQARRLAERQKAQKDSIAAVLRRDEEVEKLKEECGFEFQSDLTCLIYIVSTNCLPKSGRRRENEMSYPESKDLALYDQKYSDVHRSSDPRDETIRQLRAMVGELRGEVKSWAGLRLDRLMAGYHLNADERKAARLYREESLALLARLERGE